MPTNVTDLALDETAGDIEVFLLTPTGFSFTATAVDLQEKGVILDYLESGTPCRVFVPYSNVKQISQEL